jgi:hypothetical protein
LFSGNKSLIWLWITEGNLMKRILCFFSFISSLVIFTSPVFARHSMALSGFGGGNFQIVNTFPDLDLGAGGGIAFEYRFNQHWGLQTSLSVFDHNGSGAQKGDNGILVLNVPSIDLKYYLLGDEKRIDPFLRAGLGLTVLTGGNVSNNSGGAGMAAQIGIGSDFYLNDAFSLGVEVQFKTAGIIRGNSQSSAMIFLPVLGNFTYHFK